MYDYHTHSDFSNDCNSKIEDMVASAIQKGMKQIAITDHIDLDYLGTDMTFEFDIAAQQDRIDQIQSQYNQIEIRKGIEMGIQPHILNECSKIVTSFKPDFVLASMHMSDRKDMYNGDFSKGKSEIEAITVFYEELFEMVKQYKEYSVVGHFDILKRYDKRVSSISFETVKSLAEPAFKAIIKNDKGIEINTSGLRQGLGETLPNQTLLELYYELGGRIITLGSDAHNPEDVGHSFSEVMTSLRSIGFKELYTFKNMIPVAMRL